jgi:hypothetical protein
MRQYYFILTYLFLGLFFVSTKVSHAAIPTAVIRGAVIRGAVIAPVVAAGDPCAGTPAIGASCYGGLYAGTYNGYKYITTPGNCSDSPNPTCSGAVDTLAKVWGPNGTVTGVTGYTNGAGNTTTLAGLGAAYEAASYCQNMIYGGYSDWFLPAKDELTLLDTNKAALGGFRSFRYWTSTELAADWTWHHDFAGSGGGYDGIYYKTSIYYVRCVRKY